MHSLAHVLFTCLHKGLNGAVTFSVMQARSKELERYSRFVYVEYVDSVIWIVQHDESPHNTVVGVFATEDEAASFAEEF